MYDDNITLLGVKKDIDETKQGEVLYFDQPTDGLKKFYIEYIFI